MAVARDEDTPEQSFIPTTARMDQMDHEVARRFTQHRATEPMETASRKENREAESPKGYTEEDERGYRHLEDEQE